MPGNEEAKDFLLIGKALVFIPFRNIGQLFSCAVRLLFLKHAEEAMLAHFRVALRLLRAFHGFVQHGHDLCAIPKSSRAPALFKDSSTRLFSSRRSTFSQNSKIELNLPSSLRADVIDSMALRPTFFTAASPKRIALSCGVKYASLTLMLGGSTGISISRHSLMYLTTLSVLPICDVSKAAMNSTG